MMRRTLVAAAALLLWPVAAQADPVSLVVIGLQAAGYATAALIVGVAASVYGAADARKRARRDAARARAEYNASLQDRTATLLQATPAWRIVYGRCRAGGDIVAELTTDKTSVDDRGRPTTKRDALKHLVIRLADHACQDVHELYIAGQPVGALDANGWATAGPTDAPWARKRRVVITGAGTSNAAGQYVIPPLTAAQFAGAATLVRVIRIARTDGGGNTNQTVSGATVVNATTIGGLPANTALTTISYELEVNESAVRWSKHLGAVPQPASPYLRSVAPADWSVDHRLDGKTYIVLTLDLEDSRFQGGPPQIDADISGRLLLDPRTTPATTAWSANPALVIYDYLRAPWGYGCTAAEVDTASVIAAANACDTPVPLILNISGLRQVSPVIGPLYTCNGAFTSAESREQTLEALSDSMAGTTSYGANWRVMAGAWTAPVMDLTDDDLAGPIEITQSAAGVEDAINGVRGTYIPARASAPVDIQPYSNAVFVADDGEELWDDITLPYTDHPYRARQIARVRVEQNRLGLVAQARYKLRAWPLQPGDRVRITSAQYGWALKTFRVTDWDYDFSGGAVSLVLQEDAASVWDLIDEARADPAPNTNIANPWAAVDVAGLTATSGASTLLQRSDGTVVPRVRVSWTAPTGPHMTGSGAATEVRWGLADAVGDWTVTATAGDAASEYIIGVVDGQNLVIGVRHVNALGIAGPWQHIGHTVVGADNTLQGAQFSAATVWDFTGTAEGWVAESQVTLTPTGNALTVASTGTDPYFTSPTISIDGARHDKVRARVRRIAGSGWDGTLFYRTAGHTWSGFYFKAIPDATATTGDYVILEWDMAALTAGGADWTTSTITGLRLDLGTTAADQFAVDWIAVGRYGPVEWTGVGGRPKSFRVLATGYVATTQPAGAGPGLVNAETGAELFGASRSYMLARIRRSDGAVTLVQYYDVLGVGAVSEGRTAATLAADLNATGSDSIVVVWTHDEPQGNRLTSGLPDALYRCGASRAVFGSSQFRNRSAYILIGIGGCGEGNGFEAYQGAIDNDPNAWCDAAFSLQNGNLTVSGASYTPRSLVDYGYVGDLNATNGAQAGSNLRDASGAVLADTAIKNSELVPSISSAATTATWSGVSGEGRPQDNATVGATFGVNIGGQAGTEHLAPGAATKTFHLTRPDTVVSSSTTAVADWVDVITLDIGNIKPGWEVLATSSVKYINNGASGFNLLAIELRKSSGTIGLSSAIVPTFADQYINMFGSHVADADEQMTVVLRGRYFQMTNTIRSFILSENKIKVEVIKR